MHIYFGDKKGAKKFKKIVGAIEKKKSLRFEGTPEAVRAKIRLEYLRGEIEAERISYGEIEELKSLAKYIGPDDVLLLEWAGVPETIW